MMMSVTSSELREQAEIEGRAEERAEMPAPHKRAPRNLPRTMVGIALWLGAAAASSLQGSWTGFTPPPPGGSGSQWPANALEDVYLVFDAAPGESLQVVCSNSLEPTNACVTPTMPPRDGLNSGWSSALGVSDEARVSLRRQSPGR